METEIRCVESFRTADGRYQNAVITVSIDGDSDHHVAGVVQALDAAHEKLRKKLLRYSHQEA